MKPVYQTIFGKPDGNCFAACIASILEMGLEDVPNFCKGDNPRWMFDLNAWLHQFGLGALTVSFHDEIPLTKGWCCAGGYGGPEGVMHEVVMKDMKMVHNPHEGWGELTKVVDYTFLVVLDPGKMWGAVLDCFEDNLERKPDAEFAVNVTKLRGIAKGISLRSS